MAGELHILGTSSSRRDVAELEARVQVAWQSLGASVVGGAVGMMVFPRHPVIGFIDGWDLAGTATDLRAGVITKDEAMKRAARTAIATVGALFLPLPTALGFIASAVVAHALIQDGDEISLLDRARQVVRRDDTSERGLTPYTG